MLVLVLVVLRVMLGWVSPHVVWVVRCMVVVRMRVRAMAVVVWMVGC